VHVQRRCEGLAPKNPDHRPHVRVIYKTCVGSRAKPGAIPYLIPTPQDGNKVVVRVVPTGLTKLFAQLCRNPAGRKNAR
jgi:hypothetical protein